MVNVEKIDINTSMLGTKTSAPFYITATPTGKLGHPLRDENLIKAAGTRDIIQMIPTLAPYSLDEMIKGTGRGPNAVLYVHPDRRKTEQLIKKFENLGGI